MATRRGRSGALAKSELGDHAEPDLATIEGAHAYVDLLLSAVEESMREVGEELRGSLAERASRRREAFQIVAYKLEQLRVHLMASRHRLNDLRTLRRMLHGERSRETAVR
jgi:hypothetical protein